MGAGVGASGSGHPGGLASLDRGLMTDLTWGLNQRVAWAVLSRTPVIQHFHHPAREFVLCRFSFIEKIGEAVVGGSMPWTSQQRRTVRALRAVEVVPHAVQ